MMNNRFGKRTLIIGAIPKTIPKLGKMELIIKKAIPIKKYEVQTTYYQSALKW